MSQLIQDSGFVADDWKAGFVPLETANSDGGAVDVPSDTDPSDIPLDAPMIRVAFPSSADGRGFTIARMLRLRGYRGRLRAYGHVLADQYAMARRAGFDEVEIDADLAARQSEKQWQDRAQWQAHSYQTRLRG